MLTGAAQRGGLSSGLTSFRVFPLTHVQILLLQVAEQRQGGSGIYRQYGNYPG